jgi:two-component system NtrC family sensor kinase
VKGEIFGALVVAYWRAREFGGEDIQVLSAFAAQAASALENSRLYDEIKNQLATIERVQSQLVQIEKLSAIGQFVAGVAHELNNPLTVVLGGAELLMQQEVPPAIREELAEIHDAARRTARIVEGLSTFARQHAPSREVIDIHEVITQALRLRASQLALDNIQVVEEFDRSLPRVAADSHQIVQVLVNVINNAHQAIKGIRESGTIVIRTSRAVDGVGIEIGDDGPGIPPDALTKLFDPFFTTKPVGQGTGLGLSISHGIVRQHGGVISARNRPDGGAIFRVTLPVDTSGASLHGKGKPEAGREGVAGVPAIGGGPCRILVVDDDAHVANALAKIVASLGHRVDRAHSAEEARRKLALDHFDALILDFKMPAVDGRALWEEIRQTHPGLERSVIFMTGDVADPETSAFLARTGLPCLLKPFLPNEIPAALGAVLTARRMDADPHRA